MSERLIQHGFAGNHSDIGGSYPEEQSRLSDVALDWMIGEATSLPEPLLIDRSKLNMFSSRAGVQHCEVDAMRDAVSRWLPGWLRRHWSPSWKEKHRNEVIGALVHQSVEDRFALPSV